MRDVEGGRGGSVGVIFIVKKERWVESGDQGFGGRGRSQTVSLEKAGGQSDWDKSEGC